MHKVESFFDKFVNYVIVDLLEMECTLTILLQVFLKATNIDFFVYKTIGFIYVTDTNFIDRFSYFATAKSQIFDEGRTKRKEIYKLSVGFCLLKLHPEFEELYEQQGKTFIVCYYQNIVNCTLKNAFLESVKFFKKNSE